MRPDWDDQFRETPDETRARWRAIRARRQAASRLGKFQIGQRVSWQRYGIMTGYVTAIIEDDGRGSERIRVRSNGSSYVVLPSDLSLAD